ncbi:MAG: hypothetical protein MJ061_01425 [Mailhella sp.]|nr:hypothetical protein [Mailhella sp.]
MKQTIGIRFSKYGHIYACMFEDEGGAPLAVGDCAVITGEHGPSCGRVVWRRPWQEELEQALRAANAAAQRIGSLSENDDRLPQEDQQAPVPEARRATDGEVRALQENEELAAAAHVFCRECIAARALDMQLVDVEVLLDRSKMIFFFTAPTRIDFRDLVKDLVKQYRTRIELRQIGVRHETQMLGAIGNCGMVCCCRRYLHKFAPVTIKMAKEQNLFLNPAKISGVCGRLLCCLSYEQENYDSFHHSCPKLGKRYQTAQGPMRVLRSNMFRNTVAVLPDGGQETELTLEEWHDLKPTRAELPPSPQPPKEQPQTQSEMIVVSASPDTLDDDLADLPDADENARPATREPDMLGSEEASHKRSRRPHPVRTDHRNRIPHDRRPHREDDAAGTDAEHNS